MGSPLLEALEEHSEALRAAEHIYVGFSGGADSHSLLHAVRRFAKQEALAEITAVHVNHGLQPDADIWETHCRQVAESLGVNCIIERLLVSAKSSQEEQARIARYQAFERNLAENTVLLLGHHLDDQIETVLFRLIRGAGPQGLRGIPNARALGPGKVLRPLLKVTRAEIEDYASEHGLSSIEDPSNNDIAFDRNFLRHQVLPLIEQRWPGYRSGIARTGEIMASIAVVPADLWYECPLGVLSLEIEALEPKLLHQAIRSKLLDVGLEPPAYAALQELCRQCLDAGVDAVPTLSTSAYSLVCWRGRLQLVPASISVCEPEEIIVGQAIEKDGGSLLWVADRNGLPVGSSVLIRSVEVGEAVKFSGRPSRPIRHFMQETSIAPYWRGSVPLVCFQGEVVAVPGLGCTQQGNQIFNDNSEGLVPVWKPPKIRIGN